MQPHPYEPCSNAATGKLEGTFDMASAKRARGG